MTARAVGPARASRPRRALAALLALVLVIVALAAHALGPYLFGRVTLQNELAVQLKATSGLRIQAHHARFALLPRPRVVTDEVRIDDGRGALSLDADGLTGDVRLLPLVVGRVELSGVALHRPRITVDLAAGLPGADSTIGRALRGRDEHAGATPQRLGSLSLQDGSLRVRREGAPPLILTGIDVAIDWSDLDSAASLTGSLRLGSDRVDLALWLGSPAALPRDEPSAMVLHAHSAALDLAANGVLAASSAGVGEAVQDRPAFGFKGHLSAEAAALATLLARAAPGIVLPAAFTDASLDSEARIAADRDGLATLDLQKLAFRADGNGWEGTLAFRRGARPLVSATLATERLMLAPFTDALPAPLDAARRWSRSIVPRPRIGDVDLDLRISAAHLLCRPFTVDEAALAVISRDGRIEIALIDGRLSGGTVKARLSIGQASKASDKGLAGDALDLRGTAALTGADASALSWDAAGRQLATGTLSGSLALHGRGDSVASLIDDLAGSARISLADGEIDDVGTWRGRTVVRSLGASASLAAGIATITNVVLDGPELTSSGHGTLDLRRRMLDLRAVQTRPGGDASFAVSGPLDDLRVRRVDAP